MSTILREKVTDSAGEVEINVEVEDSPRGRRHEDYGPVRDRDGNTIPARAFSDGMRLIRACAEQVAGTVQKVTESARPSSVQVELGIKLDGEIGAIIAKTGVEGHLQVTLTWQRAAGETG